MKTDDIKLLKELGLNLIPCGFKSKRPSIEWKPYQTQKFNGDIPESGNSAVICGRIEGCTPIVVLDLDSPELADILFDDFEKIKQKTLVVQTGSGGYHVYIKPRKEDSSSGKRLTNSKGQHMDIQGDGTYVIAPGSIHPNGNTYKIISSTTNIEEINLTGFINSLSQYGFNTSGSGLPEIHEISKGVKHGMINNSAFKYACHLLSKVGLDRDTAWFEMKEWLKRCQQPTNERELESVFKHAVERIERDGVEEKKILKTTPESRDGWIEFLKKYIGENYNYDQLNEKFILNIDPEEVACCIRRYPSTFSDIVKEAMEDYTEVSRIELSMFPNIKMGSISPKVGDKILCFDCEVIAVEDRQTYTKRADFECPMCGNTTTLECDERHIIPTERCSCKKRAVMEIVEGTIEAEYVQTIWLSEGITEAKNNTPVVLKCRIFGDVVGESFAGQKKRIIGQFKSVPRKGQRFNDVLIDAISISSLDDTDVQLPTDDELQEWKERVKDPEKFFDEIIEESYGGIGNIGPKKSCFLSTISAPKTEKRINNVHVLLLGDPGTYKSTLMEETQSFTYKSIFTGGKGNTAAGLTGGMDRPAPNMPLVFLPGALTLANNGTAYIDEIDKMRDHDRESVLIGMAKGYIPINKVGIHGILPANTTIIAAANPKGGRWKPDVPVLDQTNLSEPLLSRFDIVWLIMDEVNEYRDTQISNYSVNQMNQSEEKIIDSKKIMRYINYVKTLNPELTSEAKKSITQYYVKLRMLSKEQNTLPIDPRKIEGLAKLAMARARLLMKKKTDEDDVKVATDLFEDSLRSFGIDISTGKIQETFKGSRELNKEETVWECINEIKDDRDCFTESEFIDALANTKYFDDESARKELYKWNQKLGRINLNNDGTYRT